MDPQELSEEELLAWKPRMGSLTVDEKIEQGEMLKQQANLLFKRGNLKKALRIYAMVFAYVNGISTQGDAMSQYASSTANMSATAIQGEQIQQLQIAVWSNMAFCHVKLGTHPEKAMEFCDKVLAKDDAHSKALFRKAQALVQLKHFDKAQVILTKLMTAEPKNAAVRQEMRNLQVAKKEYDQEAKAKAKQTFQNIFNKTGGGGLYGN